MHYIALFLIYVYKYTISPVLPKNCCYTPTCSEFMLQAINRHGTIKGSILGVKRLLRCNPFVLGGIDTVPDDLRIIKWVL
ncbi:MAG: membrane protein insertion efficiency factor YidD [Clostridiales bacterium]|nr:membrane protein insertion efficiency factor YidD [Clostridiales bacterium]